MATSKNPLQAFKYHVTADTLDGITGFTECTGLTDESAVQEFRTGNDAASAPEKIPGNLVTTEITLKKPVYKQESQFADWRKKVKSGEAGYKADLIITVYEGVQVGVADPDLFSKVGVEGKVFKVKQAWPSSHGYDNLMASSTEVWQETVTLQHSGIEEMLV